MVLARRANRRSLNGFTGFTLIELMISLAVVSLIGLTAATMLVNTTYLTGASNQQASQTEDLAQFNWFSHQFIDNAVAVACNCRFANPYSGAASNEDANCVFDEASVDTDVCDLNHAYGSCAGSSPIVLGTFITETDFNALTYTGSRSGCYMNSTTNLYAIWTSEALTKAQLHGCKKVINLVYKRPTAATATVASQPGTLTFLDVTDFVNSDDYAFPVSTLLAKTSGAGTKALFTLGNITKVHCGMTRDFNSTFNSSRSSMQGFRLAFSQKILPVQVSSTTRPDARGVSSYYPSDSTYGATGNAVFRKFATTYAFRNLTRRGLYFGVSQVMDCIQVDQVATDWRQCCSQRWDFATKKCTDTCSIYNGSSVVNSEGACCYHTLDSSNRCAI